MRVPVDVVRALKTLLQEGTGYDYDTESADGTMRCLECFGTCPAPYENATHDESDGPCIMRTLEDFLDKHPEVKTDVDEEAANRGCECLKTHPLGGCKRAPGAVFCPAWVARRARQ